MSHDTRPTGARIDWTAADSDVPKVAGDWPRAVFVGSAGTVKIMDTAGNISTWVVPAGFEIKGSIKQVRSTGTDADDFVLMY